MKIVAQIAAASVAASLAAAPALAWRGGGYGGFGGGDFSRGGGDWGGGSWGGDHGSYGWHQTATGTDYYHGANGVYRPPQVNDNGVYKPPAAATAGNEYHPPAAAVGADAYHPATVATGATAYRPATVTSVYRYPPAVAGYYPHGYYGYYYHPYYPYATAGIVAGSIAFGVTAAALTADALASPYPYGVIYTVPYYYGYAVPTVYTANCGGWNQPICATPVQMFAQDSANLTAAANAIQTAAIAFGGY